jgi:hypothetical protein
MVHTLCRVRDPERHRGYVHLFGRHHLGCFKFPAGIIKASIVGAAALSSAHSRDLDRVLSQKGGAAVRRSV